MKLQYCSKWEWVGSGLTSLLLISNENWVFHRCRAVVWYLLLAKVWNLSFLPRGKPFLARSNTVDRIWNSSNRVHRLARPYGKSMNTILKNISFDGWDIGLLLLSNKVGDFGWCYLNPWFSVCRCDIFREDFRKHYHRGFAPIMILILLLGTQLVTLGIMGEYLWRTYAQARGRPHYLVDSRINC